MLFEPDTRLTISGHGDRRETNTQWASEVGGVYTRGNGIRKAVVVKF